MPDLDQGGVFRETSRVYLGPSLGWSQQVSAPPVSAVTVTTPGTTVIQQGVSTVHVNVNGSVTIQLYAAKGNAAGAGQVPGSWVQTTLVVNDIGGHALAFPITIQPAAGETIGGASSVTISANFGLFVMLSDVQNGGWTVASGTSGTALTDAPSDGSSYGRLNATWAKVVPLTGGTLTGALTVPGLTVSGNGTVSGTLGVSGILTAPTAAVDTNTAQAATTAFVLAQASAVGDGTPQALGVAARGISTHYARADHVHPIFALRGYLSGLALSTAGASTTFSVAAGIACDGTFAQMMSLAASINKTTGAWAVGSGNGALDTGAIAASTWYHVFLIERTDLTVVDALVSLSPSAPTMPANYTFNRRIGSLLTSGSSQWVLFVQSGDEFIWSTPVNDIASVTVSTTPSTLFALTVPTAVKVNALLRASITNSVNVGAGLLITSPDEAATAVSTPAGNVSITAPSTTVVGRMTLNIRTNTSAQIQAVASAGSSVMNGTTFGWVDRRGRDA